MKVLIILAATFFLSALTLVSAKSKTKMNSKTESEMSSAMMEEMMKSMQEYSTPGAPHKVLEEMVGNWTYSSKMWIAPETNPEESSGTSEIKMILGGRWMQQLMRGKAMGQDYEGFGLTGYDNIKKKYQTLWMDNLSTGVMKGEGSFDKSNQTLKNSGQYTCPPNKTNNTFRGEWKIVDKKNMIYSMFSKGMNPIGPIFKNMELTFKRTK
jgi:hypothetical protein